MLAQNVMSWAKTNVLLPSPTRRPLSPSCVTRKDKYPYWPLLSLHTLKSKQTTYLDFFHSPLLTVDTFSNAYQISILCCADLLWVWSFPFSTMLQSSEISILLNTTHLQNLLASTVTFSFLKFTSLDHFQSFYTSLFLSNFLSSPFNKNNNQNQPTTLSHLLTHFLSPHIILPWLKYLHCYCQLSSI